MSLAGVGLLAVDSNRSRMYLLQMIKHDLAPARVLVLGGAAAGTPEAAARAAAERARDGERTFRGFDLATPLLEIVRRHAIPHVLLPATDPNDVRVVAAVAASAERILVYAGPGGVLLRRPLLESGKRFLHCHPGLVPRYRGSTTIYYSLLGEGQCGVTAFFMDEKIDQGPVVRRRSFPPPEDRTTIDLYYDPFIRSELLVEVLREYALRGDLPVEPPAPGPAETYYIVHPVLKHIAILAHATRT